MQRNKVSEEVGKIMKVMKLRNRNEVMKCETKMNKSILHHHPQLTNSFFIRINENLWRKRTRRICDRRHNLTDSYLHIVS